MFEGLYSGGNKMLKTKQIEDGYYKTDIVKKCTLPFYNATCPLIKMTLCYSHSNFTPFKLSSCLGILPNLSAPC